MPDFREFFERKFYFDSYQIIERNFLPTVGTNKASEEKQKIITLTFRLYL